MNSRGYALLRARASRLENFNRSWAVVQYLFYRQSRELGATTTLRVVVPAGPKVAIPAGSS